MNEVKKEEVLARMTFWELPEEKKLRELKAMSGNRPKIVIDFDRKYIGLTQKERDVLKEQESKKCGR